MSVLKPLAHTGRGFDRDGYAPKSKKPAAAARVELAAFPVLGPYSACCREAALRMANLKPCPSRFGRLTRCLIGR